ncbi:C4-dicarboxylate ABC transporter [Tsukamurella pulmonis]|uniref:Na+/H+ antiporter NhaD n=1 Tax=Tsukamurella pulmonis TaxID=47312 RepID=A0A1H1C0R7_9ACTN|nr:SLC13 family permease [Tsukamurella pulmonis]KXO90115.1 C4-dicarboxylate ABC transporter [Tsukamurella pulmonis]KXP11367.1 C4-dicarboxylate ABC transporter [Tsukamurella pulmonis]RDH10585.1 C4-dicarboxylate ABC transporter [Tsukamurella pulmonis]SDQ57793.1 Na+/H+ antiporter NhaD [Tsukamurella pulmonis]SUP24395.1 Dicarboxylate carrier protein MatC N-terminus [Tsukamurella pulmonis]
MTAPQILSVVLLLAVLVVAIGRRMNIGVLALAAALPVLAVSGFDAKAMYTAFPGDIFVLIAGVSLLFAHLERSGALALVVDRVYAAIGDRHGLLPWAGFAIGAALSTAGAFSTAPIAFLVPMIAHVGVRAPRMFLLSELAVVIGANSAGLSPLNPTGAVVRTAADKAGVHYSGWGLWAVSMAVAVTVVVILQALTALARRRGHPVEATPAPAAADEQGGPSNRWYMAASGAALIAFVALVVLAGTDVGVTAICLAALLQIAFPTAADERALLARIPWNSILLLCGLLTYLGLMQKIGTMDSIAEILRHLGTGALLILVIAYLTALLCNIESSTLGVLGLMTPIAFAAFGHTGVVFWVTAAICVPSALMVMNPIHVAGTLIIGNTAPDEQDRLFRRLLTLAGALAATAPGLLSLIPIALL